MKYVANCSFGKDSLAMVLRLLEEGKPLDVVVYFDTGMEYQAIYRNRDKLLPILKQHDVEYVELKPDEPFIYSMHARPVKNRGVVQHYGYQWCGGNARWGTASKTHVIDRYLSSIGEYQQYIGIAADEPQRIKDKLYPLVEWGMTEKDCLQYCRANGWDWKEGDIDLYDILDRVSCWCCRNKNRKELYNMYCYLPEYWERLKGIQKHCDMPMKHFCTKQYGNYGNVFDMEKVFAEEKAASDNQLRLV